MRDGEETCFDNEAYTIRCFYQLVFLTLGLQERVYAPQLVVAHREMILKNLLYTILKVFPFLNSATFLPLQTYFKIIHYLLHLHTDSFLHTFFFHTHIHEFEKYKVDLTAHIILKWISVLRIYLGNSLVLVYIDINHYLLSAIYFIELTCFDLFSYSLVENRLIYLL